MQNEKYNGWTNYATWRVRLEIFNERQVGGFVTADMLREEAREFLSNGVDNVTTLGLADAFCYDVNWDEIAEALNEPAYGNTSAEV
jgi:hypothetical protein